MHPRIVFQSRVKLRMLTEKLPSCMTLHIKHGCTMHPRCDTRRKRWRSSLVSLPDLASLDLCSPVSPPACETRIAVAAYPNRLRLIARPPLGAALRTQISRTLAPSPASAVIALSAALALSCPLFLRSVRPALVVSVQTSPLHGPAVSKCRPRCAFLVHILLVLFPFKVPPSTIGFLSCGKELIPP